MQRPALFIVNPIAGGQGRQRQLQQLLNVLRTTSGCRVEVTRKPGDAFELCRQQASGTRLVVAVGGDGTVNEVARGLLHGPVPMGIIPMGSGNGLAHHLGIPTRWQQALTQLENGRPQPIDTIEANGRLIVNVGGLGFDGHVATLFNRSLHRGKLAYISLIAREYGNYKGFRFTLHSNQGRLSGRAFILAVANGTEFGNRFQIAPRARHNDGLMNLIVVRKPPWHRLPGLLWQGYRGRLRASAWYREVITPEATIEFEAATLHTDGETAGPACRSPLHLRVLPQSLQVMT